MKYTFTIREIMNCSVETVYEVNAVSETEASMKIDAFIENNCADSLSIKTTEAGEIEVLEVEQEYTTVTNGPEHVTGIIARELGDYFDEDEVWLVLKELEESNDISVGDYRIIKTDMLQEKLAEMLGDDEEYTASFSAYFLSDLTDLSVEAIEVLQENGCAGDIYLAIGRDVGFYTMAGMAIGEDGAGHFFSHYDGSEEEIGDYTLFRVA